MSKEKAVIKLYQIFFILALISVVTVVIVDYAVSHKFTWSLIVIGGIILLFSSFSILLWNKKNRFIKALGLFSLLVIPYMGIIQMVTSDKEDPNWLLSHGIPISIIWLVVIWVSILIGLIFRNNVFFALASLSILSSPASLLTNIIAGSYYSIYDVPVYEYISSVVYVSAGLVFVALGIIYRTKKGRIK